MKAFLKRERFSRTGALAAALMIIISVVLTPAAAAVSSSAQRTLVPMGSTVGIQIHTQGVMVVGLSATGDGSAPSPAAAAGLVPGDIIIAVGSDEISCAEDFRAAVEKLDGGSVSVRINRGGETLQLALEPQMENGCAELGLWLRDSISGIGTLTYFDPQTGRFGGLGHSINDVDSGVIVPLGSGEIMPSAVSDIIKGTAGSPGELCGTFDINEICGSIEKNTINGIFGKLSGAAPEKQNAVAVADEDEIALGKAAIYANICGNEVCEYEIEIVRIYRNDQANRNMMIRVTDPKLIDATGGIVQGMSGSPILQNGKLIGAVTHVMINDPTSGFAVSIEKMLQSDEAVG